MRAAIQIKAKAGPVAITLWSPQGPLHVLAPARASNQDSTNLPQSKLPYRAII